MILNEVDDEEVNGADYGKKTSKIQDERPYRNIVGRFRGHFGEMIGEVWEQVERSVWGL